jgi:hypothetical protein
MEGQMKLAAWLQERRMQQFRDVLSYWEAGGLSLKDAADLLGISERQLRRWRGRYEEEGLDGLIDWWLGKPSPKRVPVAERERMLDLYRGTGPGVHRFQPGRLTQPSKRTLRVPPMLPPAIRTAKASALADFGAVWRRFGTCCPTLRVSCCRSRAGYFRLAGSAFSGRESNPLDCCARFQLVLTISPTALLTLPEVAAHLVPRDRPVADAPLDPGYKFAA